MTDPADPGSPGGSRPGPPKRPQKVFTLVVQVGRAPDDGLPEDATGAGLLCYSAGVDEAEAVRETVALLRQAGMAPLDVTGYGTLAERLADGDEIAPEEQRLMERALADNAVVVAQVTAFYANDDEDDPDDAVGEGRGNRAR
ncbi:MAG: hypothetical protein AAFU80_12970 [Pseudomonadota bacterium]